MAQSKENAGGCDQGPAGPLPQHENLQRWAGSWSAESTFPPGAPMPPMSGTEVNEVGCGGLWLTTDLKLQTKDGMPYAGHGITGYDPTKKAYVQFWADSMTPVMAQVSGNFDPAGRVITMTGETVHAQSGQKIPLKMSTEFKDSNTRIFTMYGPGPDGREFPMMTITYKRRK